ncbi:hypothetical protein Trydic_g13092 [Trypoxylus dichotomus]
MRGRQPDRANPLTSARNTHGRGGRRPGTTNITGRGESHHQVIPIQGQFRPQGRTALPTALSGTPPGMMIPKPANLPAHQPSPGDGRDYRPDNIHKAAGGNRRSRRYPQLPIRIPQRASRWKLG